MPDHHLNIISFTIPFPANYGGVIDVFYKLVALKAQGIRIHLHCFQYDRQPATELEKYCETVNYYRRKTGILEQLSLIPYIINGRRSNELLKNLLSNDYPILFEGLHSCYYLNHPLLKSRKRIYRESNIEHQYYYHLYLSEKKLIRKLFFLLESKKLNRFQNLLSHATEMLVVSENDGVYLKEMFPGQSITYLPSFHGNSEVRSIPGRGEYALYHGNLSVAENIEAVEFLINKIFGNLNVPLIIAGLNPSAGVKQFITDEGILLFANPSPEKMDELIREAHLNILVTFQATGLKLKLLNTLYNGRFVLVNNAMVAGTGLDNLCYIADSPHGIINQVKTVFNRSFDKAVIAEREKILLERYSDEKNAVKLIDIVFPRTK